VVTTSGSWGARNFWRTYGRKLVCISILLSATGCGRLDEQSLLRAAQERLDRQEFAAAVIHLKNLLAEDPDSTAGRFMLGQALLASGDVAGAETELSRAERLGHPVGQLYPAQAELLLAKGEARAAIYRFGDVRLDDPRQAAALGSTLARAQLEVGETAAAADTLRAALALVPDFAPALVLQARLAANAGQVDEARRVAAELTRRETKEVSAWVLQGDLLAAEGKESKAASDAYRRAIVLKRRLPEAHAGLVTSLLKTGDLSAAAIAAADMRRDLPRSPLAMFHQALVAYLQGDFPAARERMQEAMAAGGGGHPRLLLLAGTVESRLGALAQAEELLLRAVQGMPDDTRARRELAALHLQRGQAARALATLQPLLAANIADAEVWRLAGQAQLLAGDFKQADRAFAAAMRLGGEKSGLSVDLARSLMGQGRQQQAVDLLEKTAREDASGIGVDMALLAAHMSRRDFAAATKVVDGMSKKAPASAMPDYLRGRVQLSRHDVTAARASFGKALAMDPTHFPSVHSLATLDVAALQFDAARARYEALLQRQPKSATALLAMGAVTRLAGGSREQSAAWIDRAVAVNVSDPEVWLGAIEFHRQRGDDVAALARARSAAAAVPSDPAVLGALADLQLAQGDIQQAVGTVKRLVDLRPNAADVHMRAIGAYVAFANLDRARFHSDKLLDLAPQSPIALRAAAMVAHLQKQPQRALEIARGVQVQQSAKALGWQMEGEIARDRDDWPGAVAAFRRALAKEDSTEIAMQLHAAQLRAGSVTAAAEHADGWLKAHPNDVAFMNQVAEKAMLGGDLARAEVHYRKALKLQPDVPKLLNNLALVLMKRGAPEALSLAQRAARIAPDSAAILDTLAQAYAAARDFGKAVEWQTKAVELAPQSGEFRFRLAGLHLAAGNRAKAREELGRLERTGPPDVRPEDIKTLQLAAQG